MKNLMVKKFRAKFKNVKSVPFKEAIAGLV